MDSRIVDFKFRVAKDIRPGLHKLKLWVYDQDVTTLDFRVARRGEPHRRTYVSRFDGMVRGYSVRESLTPKANQPIVMFTYGGGRSSLLAMEAFKPKTWCHLISPNFRTQNWDGLARRDALESLEVASKALQADPTRLYLLGHSMGGHGVYQMAALNPKAFAGIGSSAGWLSVFSYLSEFYAELKAPGSVPAAFRLAMEEGDLEKRYDEIASVGNVSIVHGDQDKPVPIQESFRIANELEKRGTRVNFFVQKGADHAWDLPNEAGNHYDFPPIFEAFRTSPHRGAGQLWQGAKVHGFWANCLGRRCVAVYGTRGSPSETRIARDRARKESVLARLFYQLDCEVLPDTATPQEIAGRNVILFGTPTSNRLWKSHPTAGRLLAWAERKGLAYAAWLVQGAKGKQVWSAIGGKTEAGCRLAYSVNPLDSYRRFPQWLLFDSRVATEGIQGVAAAGFEVP